MSIQPSPRAEELPVVSASGPGQDGGPGLWPASFGRALRVIGLLALFAGFVAAHVVASRKLLHSYPDTWSWSELLVDYQGGFVKRGLLGEAAYRLRDIVSPGRLVVDVVCGAYILASAGMILVLRLPATFAGLLFLLSPAGWLFPLLNPAAYGRKDAVVVAAIVTSLVIATRWRRRTAALVATMGVFTLAGLVVEIAWFYYPLVVAASLARWHRAAPAWRLSATAAAAVYTIACLALTLASPHVDTAAIAASWDHRPYDTDVAGALCCLNFGLSAAVSVARATLPNLGGYAAAAALGLLPLILLWTRHPPRRTQPLTHAVALAGLVSAMAPVFVASDWGRYLYLWLTATFLWAATAPRDRAPEVPERDATTAYGLVLRAGLLIVYASTWQVVHYQFTDRSALIPGLLFRALGVPSNGPLPD